MAEVVDYTVAWAPVSAYHSSMRLLVVNAVLTVMLSQRNCHNSLDIL